jgi:hypothetical protein
MFTIYDEGSMIIAFRKNLFTSALKEEDIMSRKVDFYKEGRGKELYFPPYINDSIEGEDVIRYCYDKNKQLRIIQLARKDQPVNAVYFMDVMLYKQLHTALDCKFHFAGYSYLYSILNDENNTLYNIKISPDKTPEQKLTILYDDVGDLKRITFSGEEDIAFFVPLCEIEATEIEKQ